MAKKYIMAPKQDSARKIFVGGVQVPREGKGVELPEAEVKILLKENSIVEAGKGKKAVAEETVEETTEEPKPKK